MARVLRTASGEQSSGQTTGWCPMANESRIKLFFVENASVERYTDALSALSIQTVKGTMKFHQVICSSPQKIKCRDISCLCLQQKGKFDCPCFDFKYVELVVEGRTAVSDPFVEDGFAGKPTQETTSYQISSWCVLLYDEIAYPGNHILPN